MTHEEIIRMAREAGFTEGDISLFPDLIAHFAFLVAAVEREKLVAWMMRQGYATGHGDTVEDLLKEFNWQVREEERELCAQICEQIADAPSNMVLGVALDCAAAIRARGEK